MHDEKDNKRAIEPGSRRPFDVVMSLRSRLHDTDLDEIMGVLRDAVCEPPREQANPATSHGHPGTKDELSLDELMRRVQKEVERRHLAEAEESNGVVPEAMPGHEALLRWQSSASRLPLKREYVLAELLQFSDAEFLDTAYRVLLHRPVDAESRESYLDVLRHGYMSKVEVLGHIRFSEEGKRCGVHVDGLLKPYLVHRWRRIPVIGYFIGFAVALVRLPRLSHRLQAIENSAARETQELAGFLNRSIEALETRLKADAEANQAVHVQLQKMSNQRKQDLHSAVSRIESLKRHLEKEREALRLIAKHHQQLEQEARTRFGQLEGVAAGLKTQLQTIQEQSQSSTQDVLSRITSVHASTESLNEEFEKYRSARNKTVHDIKEHLATVDAAMADLAEDIRLNRMAREKAVGDLVERLAELSSATSDLDEKFRTERDTRSESLQTLLERLSVVDSATKSLGEEFREYQAARNAVAQDLADRLEVLDTDTANVGDQLRANREERDRVVNKLVERIVSVDAMAADLEKSMQSHMAELEKRHQEVVHHLSAHDSMIDKLKMGNVQTRRSGLEVQRQLMKLLDSVDLPVHGTEAEGTPLEPAGDHVLLPEYVTFEDSFRGEWEDIKARVGEYLKTLASYGIGPDRGPVVDLGCGRGEWLEVLTAEGFSCRGVDLNAVMVEESRARGFDVTEGDALAYLRDLADESVAVITSMHLVEHVPHNMLIRMLDECHRVLLPGGLLILETPNPENLTVGACWFYLDPTHRNPIPPSLLEWTVQARGFTQTRIERLSEHRSVPDIPLVAEDVPAAAQINKMIAWFTAPPDYAVIAQKLVEASGQPEQEQAGKNA